MASIEDLQRQLETLQGLGVAGDIPGTASEILMQNAVPVRWMPGSIHQYEITPDGDLEFPCLDGCWRIIRGANTANAEDARRWLIQIGVMVEELSAQYDTPLSFHDIYLTHPRFRSLADNLMAVSGFQPEWWKPSQLKWLLFQRVEEIEETVYLIAPPIPLLLESSREPWMPSDRKGARTISRRAEIVAMLAGACGGDLSKANHLAESNIPYREIIDQLDAWQYFQLSTEQRKEIEVNKWRRRVRADSRTSLVGSPQALSAATPAPTDMGVGFEAFPPSPDIPKPQPRVNFGKGKRPGPKAPTAKGRGASGNQRAKKSK